MRGWRRWLIIASAAASVALLVGYYNYATAGTTKPAFPGTDTPGYIAWLKEMAGGSIGHALGYAAGNERFLYLVVQYVLYEASGLSPEGFVTFAMPTVLTFLLMIATYLLVSAGKPLLHAVTAMLVSALSLTVTVGLYAGIYANWLAFAMVLLFYSLLLRAVKVRTNKRSRWLLIPAALTSAAVLYVHLWTWMLLIVGVLTAYAVLSLQLVWARRVGYDQGTWEVKIIAILLAANLATAYLTYRVGSFQVGVRGIVREVERRASQASLSNILRVDTYLDRTLKWYVGGFYAYAPIFIFSILGVISMLDYRNSFNRLMLTWMVLCSSMILFKFPVHARFLYLTPFSIYTTLGIIYGAQRISRTGTTEADKSKRMAGLLFWVLYLLAILLLVNYLLRSVVIKQFGGPGLTVFA